MRTCLSGGRSLGLYEAFHLLLKYAHEFFVQLGVHELILLGFEVDVVCILVCENLEDVRKVLVLIEERFNSLDQSRIALVVVSLLAVAFLVCEI